MKHLLICFLLSMTLGGSFDSDEYDYSDYYEDKIAGSKPDDDRNDMSTTPPPLYKKGGPNDIKIDQIPICWDDPDNIDCRPVYINVKDLENREKINLDDVGLLYLESASEENGIHSLVYSGEGDVTAYFTYFGSSLMGTINRQDGKIAKIMSTSEHKQVMSLIDVPHSLKTEDDEGDEIPDSDYGLNLRRKKVTGKDEGLLNIGLVDPSSMTQLTVTVYYNDEAEKQMMFLTPKVFIADLVQTVNHGYRKSKVPIKMVLHAFNKTESDELSGVKISETCQNILKTVENDLDSTLSEIMKAEGKQEECYRKIVGSFRKSKGRKNENGVRLTPLEQSKKVRMGANLAVLLVHEIPDWPEFCGRASKTYDIAIKKTNLAVVSIAGGCPFTFGHEIGHILGLEHQKGGEESNPYFNYGHGHHISKKNGRKEGTRTVMATAGGAYKKRLNVYSNPEEGTGESDTSNNARVLRETRYLAAYTDEQHRDNMKYKVNFEEHTCQASSQCINTNKCPDVMRPKTFIQKMCGTGKVCCEKSPECVNKFPEIEHKKDGWFMFGNRQHNHTLGVGSLKSDGVYETRVSEMKEGNTKQMWKWEGDLLVSRWNQEYVFDVSVTLCIVAKRTGSKYQKWRLSDGYLVNLGICGETTVRGGMSIARKWYREEVKQNTRWNRQEVKQNTRWNRQEVKQNTKPLPSLTFNTYLCLDDEICTDMDHCYEAVTPATLPTKFCDKDKVCCKNKVCHDVKEFEDTETPVAGWFVIESEMNQKYLTVKDGTAVHGQQVVNSSPKTDKKGQLWMWNEGYIVSELDKLDKSLVLDGSFGKVSIKNKKHGNIYQKWRKSGGFFVNAGHCEVLDVAYGKTDNDALVTIWSVHGKSHQKWTINPV